MLLDQPVSRMPSLHIAYALFKEHESTIVDGAKVIADSRKGAYLINPGQDLPVMEKRLDSFISYWCPEWKGLAGVTPSAQEFQDLLTACNIFMYVPKNAVCLNVYLKRSIFLKISCHDLENRTFHVDVISLRFWWFWNYV